MTLRPSCCSSDSLDGAIIDAPAVNLASISAGEFFTCGIKMHDRTAVCWGVDTFGQVISVPSDELTSISAGAYHVCGIKAVDNTVVCWGKNIDGQLDETVGGTIAAGTS